MLYFFGYPRVIVYFRLLSRKLMNGTGIYQYVFFMELLILIERLNILKLCSNSLFKILKWNKNTVAIYLYRLYTLYYIESRTHGCKKFSPWD